jgi:hypothetical protein
VAPTLWDPLERVSLNHSIQCQLLRLALSKGPHRVGATPFPFFYLKTEAESASEMLFLKKRTLDDG